MSPAPMPTVADVRLLALAEGAESTREIASHIGRAGDVTVKWLMHERQRGHVETTHHGRGGKPSRWRLTRAGWEHLEHLERVAGWLNSNTGEAA